MRIDHLAFRVKNRKATTKFLMDALKYKIQTEFNIKFDDGTMAECIALEPPEKQFNGVPWPTICNPVIYHQKEKNTWEGKWAENQEYHLPPEIFVSDGEPNSIVGKWVADRNGIGGLHHIAYMVDSVKETMNEWKEKGYAEFLTKEPLTCPGLTQVFTKPSELTGVIYEFIERENEGFCTENVKDLMISTKEI